jgi:hypothetical protein
VREKERDQARARRNFFFFSENWRGMNFHWQCYLNEKKKRIIGRNTKIIDQFLYNLGAREINFTLDSNCRSNRSIIKREIRMKSVEKPKHIENEQKI